MEKIISLVITTGTLIGMLYAFWSWYHKHNKYIRRYSKYSKIKFFYSSSFIKEFISTGESLLPHDSDYVDYSLALRNGYYAKCTKKINVKTEEKILEIELPYMEIINYINSPESIIRIKKSQLGDQFALSTELIEQTENNLQLFLQNKPNTYNGEILRFMNFNKVDNDKYECELQPAKYFDQVRTNLMLDMPLHGEDEETIRIKDLQNTGVLKTLSESIMVNSIGVSAIWYTPTKNKNIKDRFQFFLKPRKSRTGIFYDTLGSVSGVVEPPTSGQFDVDCLEEYLKKEILREFYEETNFNEYMKEMNIEDKDIQIIPLAFLRELTRGGKPQFMFAIKTPYIDDNSMEVYFKKSINGLVEFENSFYSRIKQYKLSPETYVNLLYTLNYIQRNQFLEYIDLN